MNVFDENPLFFLVDNARSIYPMDAFEDVRRIVELADMGCDARSRLSGFRQSGNRRCHERVRAASRNWQNEEELREDINLYGSTNAVDSGTYFRLQNDPNRSYLASSPNRNNYCTRRAMNVDDNYIDGNNVSSACKSDANFDDRKSPFRRMRHYGRRSDFSETTESLNPRLPGQNRENICNSRLNSASIRLSENSCDAGYRGSRFGGRKNSRCGSTPNCEANIDQGRLSSFDEINFTGYPSNRRASVQKSRKCWNHCRRDATSSIVNGTSPIAQSNRHNYARSYAKNKKLEESYDTGTRSRPTSASSRPSKESRFSKLFDKDPSYVETESNTLKTDDPLKKSHQSDLTMFPSNDNFYEVTEEIFYPQNDYANLVDRAVDKDSISDYSQFSRNANCSESDTVSIASGISLKISDVRSSDMIVETEVDPAFWKFVPFCYENSNEASNSPRTKFDSLNTERRKTSTKNGPSKSGTENSMGDPKVTSSSVTIAESRPAAKGPQNSEDSRAKNVGKSEGGAEGRKNISKYVGSAPNESRSKIGVNVIGKTAARLKRRFVLGKSKTESGVPRSDDSSAAKEIRARPESLARSRLPIRIAGRSISKNPLAAYRRADANSDGSEWKADGLAENQRTCENSVRSRTKPRTGKSTTENSWEREKLIASN